MPRRRMIDPNIWQSEDFSNLSVLAKLVFIGLFSNADDEGRGRAKPMYIKSILFPYDEKIRLIDIETALSEIALNLSVTFYSADNGNQYYALDNWAKWQTIDKPKPSQIPAPQEVEGCRILVADESPTSIRRVADESRLNRKEKEREKNSPPLPPSLGGLSPELESAFSDWLAYKAEKRQAYKPTGLKSLVTQIRGAASEYGDKAVAELIRECMASNWQGIIFDRLKNKGQAQKPGGSHRSPPRETKPGENAARMRSYLQEIRAKEGADSDTLHDPLPGHEEG